jgi:hypothetical protein
MAYEDYPSQTGQSGARLTAGRRKALPASKFVFPKERAYPLDTENRARNALSRGSQNASPAKLAKIRSAVHSRYPGIKQQAGARNDWAAKDYPGEKIRGRAGKGVGARGHADEAEDRALIKRMMSEHDRGKGKGDGTQFGARMAPMGRDHALAMASATHLHRMGHIDKKQLTAIHAHAKNALAAGRGAPAMGGAAPGPVAGPAPPPMPGGNAPMGGMGGPPGGMSFGSLAPPDLG